MKENKFLFYGCITVIIVCVLWLGFLCLRNSVESVYEEPMEYADTTMFVDYSEDDVEDNTPKPNYEVLHRCESPTLTHHIVYERGNIIAEEYDTYNSQCKCMVALENQKPMGFGSKYISRTMFESDTPYDTTAQCDEKCQMVCEQSFDLFLEDNPNFMSGANGKFIGCSSQFESQKWAQNINGQSNGHHYSTSMVTCECAYGDSIIKKTERYQYDESVPNDVDLDCNKKCTEICAK